MSASLGHMEIPSIVGYQAINFFLFVALIYFYARRPIREFFESRVQIFQQAVLKSESARKQAEQKKKEIEDRLVKLNAGADEDLAKAHAEALELRHKIIHDANLLAQQLKQDAERSIELEWVRAKEHLREEILAQAVGGAHALLREKVQDADQKRLHDEFIKKIHQMEKA